MFVSAANRAGVGPFSSPSMLRLDPHTKRLDHGYTRYGILSLNSISLSVLITLDFITDFPLTMNIRMIY